MNKIKLSFVFLVLIFSSFNLNAHQISQSFSNWTVENENIMAVFSVTSRQVTLLPVLDGYSDNLSEQLTKHLKKNIKVFINEKECDLAKDIPTKITDESSLKSLLNFKCSENTGIMKIIRFFQFRLAIFILHVFVLEKMIGKRRFLLLHKKMQAFHFHQVKIKEAHYKFSLIILNLDLSIFYPDMIT